MANQTPADNGTRHRTDTAINFTPPSNRSKKVIPSTIDDLIVSLANAHENRRARQVNEWEELRHRNFPMTV